MKKVFLAVMVAMFFASQVMAGAAPDQVYFDGQFSKLQQSVAEVKGDTTQIVSILGNVFEGTVPRGGNLITLCNQHGWNLIVLMGHNGIDNPDAVAAEAKFQYPKTAEEFQVALKKGKPLYDGWLAKQKTTFRVNRIKVDTAEIDTLNIRVANIKEKLAIKDMEIDKLKIREVEITEHLRIKQAEIEDLRIKNAEIQSLKIENLEVKNALFHKLRVKELEIVNLKELLAQAQVRCQELKARGKACPEGMECGNRNSNPKWRFVSRDSFGGVPVIYGNIDRDGGPWIQSKWFVLGCETQIVVTNWDGRSDISSRLAAAQKEALRMEQRLRSGQLSYNCGQNHCYVCEF
jgi:hypothetical protein